jgi:hypothetical protein
VGGWVRWWTGSGTDAGASDEHVRDEFVPGLRQFSMMMGWWLLCRGGLGGVGLVVEVWFRRWGVGGSSVVGTALGFRGWECWRSGDFRGSGEEFLVVESD